MKTWLNYRIVEFKNNSVIRMLYGFMLFFLTFSLFINFEVKNIYMYIIPFVGLLYSLFYVVKMIYHAWVKHKF